MAYEEVTSPILTDATGQEIVDKLDAIAQAVQPPTNIEASDVSYDNTQSGMTATDAQGAIDELKSNLTELTPKKVTHNFTGLSNSSSSNYYTTLSNNIMTLTELADATMVIGVWLSDWNGVGYGNGALSLCLKYADNKLYVMYPKGSQFTNGNVEVTFVYI